MKVKSRMVYIICIPYDFAYFANLYIFAHILGIQICTICCKIEAKLFFPQFWNINEVLHFLCVNEKI